MGCGALSFRPEANLAGQVARVGVYAGCEAQEAIVGRATADDVASPSEDHRAERNLSCVRRGRSRRSACASRYSQAEADKRAKAELGELTKKFLTGDGNASAAGTAARSHGASRHPAAFGIYYVSDDPPHRRRRLSHEVQGEEANDECRADLTSEATRIRRYAKGVAVALVTQNKDDEGLAA
jgi:hypothetical protein